MSWLARWRQRHQRGPLAAWEELTRTLSYAAGDTRAYLQQIDHHGAILNSHVIRSGWGDDEEWVRLMASIEETKRAGRMLNAIASEMLRRRFA